MTRLHLAKDDTGGKKVQPAQRHMPEPLTSMVKEISHSAIKLFRDAEARAAERKSIFISYSIQLAQVQGRALSYLKLEAAERLTAANKLDNKLKGARLREIEAWATEVVKRFEESQIELIRLIKEDVFHLPSMQVAVDLILLPKGTRMNWIMKATRNLAVFRVFGSLDPEFVDAYALLVNRFDNIDYPNKLAESIANKRAMLFVVKNEAGWVIAAALKQSENLSIVVRKEYNERHLSAFIQAAIATELSGPGS